MSKSPLGYTEASNATPPAGGGSRPDSNASTEPSESTGTSVATERFGHTDQMKDHRILVVDDEPASRRGLQELLTVWGYDVTAAGDGQEALERAAVRAPDLVIADLVMPGIDGLELLTRLKRDFPTTAVVFLTGQGSIESAVQAIKDGAYDYLTKPVDPTRLQLLLDRALERSETAREVQLLRRQLRQRGAFGRLLGSSRGMMEVMRQVEVSAPTKGRAKALQDGTLREDLYYRLNVFAIALPPLRDRLEDLGDLAQAFVEEFNDRHGRNVRGVDESALDVLRRHRWPGNVRELRNVIERAVIVCSGDLVRTEQLPPLGAPIEPVTAATEADLVLPIGTTVEDAEKELILRTLKQTGGNKTRAAEVLGISLKTLHNKLHKYNA